MSGNRIQIRVLGAVQLLKNGMPVNGVRSRKALALLLYLAIVQKRVTRLQLADLLWEEQPEKRARANLSWAINHIKSIVPDCISADRHTVQFNMENRATEVDLHQFGRLPPPEAVAWVQGELLEGFLLNDCPRFEMWLLSERERVRQLITATLQQAVIDHRKSGQFEQALTIGQQLLRMVPLQEQAHRTMMQLLADTGNRDGALEQYRACRRLLADELGVKPSAETVALFEKIAGDAPQVGNNALPDAMIPLFGRKSEVTHLETILENETSRIVTLVGTGGIGKTRLAVEMAWRLRPTFADGACFVPLSAVEDVKQIGTTVAQAVGCVVVGTTDIVAALGGFLATKQMLIVLDNFEQLSNGAGTIAAIAAKAPRVRWLVTSQVRLRVSAETIVPLTGLDDIAAAHSLFLHAARQQNSRYNPFPNEIIAIDAICAELQGSPLAIQLAAAWIQLLTPQQILAEIRRSLDFLTGTLRDVPQRHRSLRTVFDYAWQMLTDPQRNLLTRIAIFPGDFDYETAASVADAYLPTLLQLVNRTVVHQQANRRFRLHGLLREFVLEKLRDQLQLLEELRKRFVDHYTDWLDLRLSRLNSTEQQSTIQEIRRDMDNVRAAWQMMITDGAWQQIAVAAETVFHFLTITGRSFEALGLFHSAVEAARGNSQARPVEGRLTVRLGLVCSHLADLHSAENYLRSGRSLLLESETEYHALAMLGEATIARDRGDFERSTTIIDPAIEILQQGKREYALASAHNLAGTVAGRSGALDSAETHYQNALTLFRKLGNRLAMTQTINNLAILAWRRGDLATATNFLKGNASIFAELDDLRGQALTYNNIATLYYTKQQYAEAEEQFALALPLCRQIGDRWLLANVLAGLGFTLAHLNDSNRAKTILLEALLEADATGSQPMILFVVVGLTTLLRLQGAIETAVSWLTTVLQHPDLMQESKRRAELERDALVRMGVSAEIFEQPSSHSLSLLVDLLLSSPTFLDA